MLELFYPEHQLELFREFETRRSEFLRLDTLDKLRRIRDKEADQKSDREAHRMKTKGQIKAYLFQRDLIKHKGPQSVPIESTLSLQESSL